MMIPEKQEILDYMKFVNEELNKEVYLEEDFDAIRSLDDNLVRRACDYLFSVSDCDDPFCAIQHVRGISDMCKDGCLYAQAHGICHDPTSYWSKLKILDEEFDDLTDQYIYRRNHG